MNRWREYFTTLLVAIIVALIVRNYFLTAYRVPSGSMQPTFKAGDLIFTSRTSYGYFAPFVRKKWAESLPSRGDLVVFSYPHQPGVTYLKRVIGLPGDRVQIVGDRLIINEDPLRYEKVNSEVSDNPNPDFFEIFKESASEKNWNIIFQKKQSNKNLGPFIVPPGEVFLMGDNRDASDDSRHWGTVPMNHVEGRVFMIWLSLDWQNRWAGGRYPSVRWERVFSVVH